MLVHANVYEYIVNASEIHRQLVKYTDKNVTTYFPAPNVSIWVPQNKFHILFTIYLHTVTGKVPGCLPPAYAV